MKVLVTNAHSRIAYCCIRALAEQGHTVIAGDFVPLAMSFYSKYTSERFRYPSPYKDPATFLEYVLEVASKHGVQFILPIHEETFIFSKFHNKIPEDIRLTVPAYKDILTVHNKDRLSQKAVELGIPTPIDHIVKNKKELDLCLDKIDYPVVLKPRQGGGNYGIKFVYEPAHIKETFLTLIEDYKLNFEQVQIQQYVQPAEKYSQVMIFANGKIKAKFTDKHIRDYPARGGAGCLRVSTKFPEIEQYTEELLTNLSWHGVAEAEYILDENEHKPYLIEINPRIWGGVNSAISSGLNIPDLLLKIACNEPITEKDTFYKPDIRSRWLIGDLKTLFVQLKGSENKLHTFIDSFNILNNDISIDEFCIKDPVPFFIHPVNLILISLKKCFNKKDSYYSLLGEWE